MNQEEHRPPAAGRFWRRFGALFGLGIVGILALAPALAEGVATRVAAEPEMDLPLATLVALALIEPTVLLAISVALGVRLGPRLGLRSHLDERVALGRPILPELRPELPLAIALGLATGTAILLLDAAFQPLIGAAAAELREAQPRTLAVTLAGMLYGGITEELMVRWGLMSLLAWASWRMVPASGSRPGAGAMWGAVIGSAIAFGFAHLPAVAALVPLTTPLIVRTVLLNALGGMVFGWLFWRRSLEAAMVAHASSHIVFSTVAWLS